MGARHPFTNPSLDHYTSRVDAEQLDGFLLDRWVLYLPVLFVLIKKSGDLWVVFRA